MNARNYAMYGGLLFLAMGVISLIPGIQGTTNDLIPLDVNLTYAKFLGLFPLNIFNKIALIAYGVFGILAARKEDLKASIYFCRAVCLGMIPLSILGMFPATQTLGGLWPLYGNEVISHGIFGLIGGYFGFVESRIPHQHHA